MRFDTRLIHVDLPQPSGSGDVVAPLHLSVAYEPGAQDPPRYFYGRGENPTRELLERTLAALEDVGHAVVFPSGQAAAAAALAVLASHGRPVLAVDDVYAGTHELFETVLGPGAVRYADLSDPAVVDGVFDGPAAPGHGALIWIETPTNPMLKLVDLTALSARARAHGATVLVDNTLAGPALQQPLSRGAHVTLYSTTKSIAGHLDVLGGALVLDDTELHDRLLRHRTITGAVPGAQDCYLVLRGLRTLAVRTERQVATARAIATALAGHPGVTSVLFPGLATHPQHHLAEAQMTGPGGVLAFRCPAAATVIDRLTLFAGSVSLGGVRSLAQRPAVASHRTLPAATCERLGITADLVRLSVGVEAAADLIDDLMRALDPVARQADDPGRTAGHD
jgi:methionine gamma-lyase